MDQQVQNLIVYVDWSEHSSVSSEGLEVRQNLGISLADVYPLLSSPFIL